MIEYHTAISIARIIYNFFGTLLGPLGRTGERGRTGVQNRGTVLLSHFKKVDKRTVPLFFRDKRTVPLFPTPVSYVSYLSLQMILPLVRS